MIAVPEAVKIVLETLEQGGFSAWCVGGCVRDGLLGRPPDDWDVATSALPEETMAAFPDRAFPTGLRHGTVTVRLEGLSVEVTTFRTDGPYLDGRHPSSVAFTPSLEADLARRDFTVNAMALDLRGELADPFGGRTDLRRRLLRCVGDPDRRFGEDALRILRCLRLSSALGFPVEAGTAESLRRNRALLGNIAAERVRAELDKLLCGPHAAEVLRAFPEVLGAVVPEVTPMVGFDQHNPHHCYDVWEHTLHALEYTPAAPVLRWAVLLHDVGKPKCFTLDDEGCGHFYGHPAAGRELAAEILRRLKFDNDSRDAVLTLVEWHDREIPRTDRGVRRALMKLGEERLRQLLAVKRADNYGQAPVFWERRLELARAEGILDGLLARDACFSLRQLAVNGRDLIALGLSGPRVGRALQELLDLVVGGEFPNRRDALLGRAREQLMRK